MLIIVQISNILGDVFLLCFFSGGSGDGSSGVSSYGGSGTATAFGTAAGSNSNRSSILLAELNWVGRRGIKAGSMPSVRLSHIN